MKKLFKTFVVLVLILSFSAPAFAIAPLVLTAVEMLWPTVVLSGFGMLLPKSKTAHVPSFGRAAPSGFSRNLLGKVGPYAAIAVAGYLAYDELRDKYDPNKYPSFHDLLYKKNPALSPIPDPNDPTNLIGKEVAWMESGMYGTARILSVSSPFYPGPSWGSGLTPFSGAGLYYFGASLVYAFAPKDESKAFCYMVTVAAVTSSEQYIPRTDAEIAQELTDPSTGDLSSEYLNDIDKMIADNPGSVQLPSDLAQQISDAEDQLDPSSQTDTDGDGIPDSEDPDIDGDGIPNSEDPDADGDGIPDADVPPDDEIEITSPELPSLHSIDLSPLLNIGNAITEKFPFSLLSTVSSMATSLLSSPVAPVFTIHFPSPFDYDWVVSLERWDSWASLFRFLIGSSFLVAISMSILRRWV